MSRGYGDRDRDRGGDRDCKVYVGDLPNGVCRQDLEEKFNPYGYLKSVWVARNPPGFAFVEFEDARDAKDAARELDGTRICGRDVKVEVARGRSRRGGGGGGYGGGGGGGGYGRGPPRDRRNDSCYACGEKGHFARDCPNDSRSGGGGGGGRSYGGGGGRSYGGGGRSYNRRSRSRSRSRSESPPRRRERSKSRSPSPKD